MLVDLDQIQVLRPGGGHGPLLLCLGGGGESGESDASGKAGQCEFCSLFHCMFPGTLAVSVISVNDLKAGKYSGQADVYVK